MLSQNLFCRGVDKRLHQLDYQIVHEYGLL
jgi:hypothetical protein